MYADMIGVCRHDGVRRHDRCTQIVFLRHGQKAMSECTERHLSTPGVACVWVGCHMCVSGVPPVWIWSLTLIYTGRMCVSGAPPVWIWTLTFIYTGCCICLSGVPRVWIWSSSLFFFSKEFFGVMLHQSWIICCAGKCAAVYGWFCGVSSRHPI